MFDRNLMKLPGMHAVMGALVVLALLQAAAIAGQALSLSSLIAHLWEGAQAGQQVIAVEAVAPGLAAFLACFVLLQIVRFAQETMLDRYALDQAGRLRGALLGGVFDARTMLAQRVGAASVATTVTNGVDEVQSYVALVPPKAIGMAAISIPLLIVVFVIDWPSGIILAVMFPVIIFFMVLLGRQARDRAERQYSAYTRLANRFLDTLRGLDVIRAFGASKSEGDEVHAFSERLRRATVRTLTTATLSSAVLDLCATFGVAAVAMMLAFRLMDGSISLATGLAALMLAPEYFTPIRSFASDFHASLDGKNALAAILDLLEKPVPRADSNAAARNADAASDDASAHIATQFTPEWSEGSTLEFRNVSFAYDETGSGVSDVSFKLGGNEKVALLGRSGAGKSTLAKLVAGLVEPASGDVLIDGKPVDLASAGWKAQVRVIPQNPYIFAATLAENVSFYSPCASRELVERAVHVVGLDELVSELPFGLDTPIGEGARGLSGGQAHRVALARVLLDDQARILVFDEPTAHLDIETELDLKERMLPLMEGKLVIFATHRRHWLANMDRAITLEHGSVVHDETIRATEINGTASQLGQSGQVPSTFDSASSPISELEPSEKEPVWARQFLKRYKRSAAIAIALGFLASGCAALLMFTSGYLISATSMAGITLFAVMVPVALVQLFGFGRPVARYLERLLSHDWVLKVTSDLRRLLFWGVERSSSDPARRRAVGEYLGLLADDIAHLQNLYLRVVFPAAIALLMAIGTIVLFGSFSIPAALLALLAFALVALAIPLVTLSCTRKLALDGKQSKAAFYSSLTDDVLGAVDWVLAGRGEAARKKHGDAAASASTVEVAVRLRTRSFSFASTLIMGALVCGIVAWAAHAFSSSPTSANYIAAFALGAFPLIEHFAQLPAAFAQIPVHEDAVSRLDGYVVDEPGDEPHRRGAVLETSSEVAHGASIEAKAVSYAYPNTARMALDELTLSIETGSKVAVLGRSGSGKSTFADVVRGELEPSAGTVEVRGVIGYLGQVPYLFNRTLRENLALGCPDADDAHLVSALESVGLGSKLAELESGLDTIVGETGVGLSGGEAHRVAFARVLVADADVIIVDEPFAALDPETENALLGTLFDTCKGRTLVVITHHLAQVERFDRVLFIEDGRLDMDGTPQELLQTSNRFRELIAFDRS